MPPPSRRGGGRLDKVTNESEKEFIEDINCPLRSAGSIRKTSEARYLIVVVPMGKGKNVLRSLLPFAFSEAGIISPAALRKGTSILTFN